MALQHLRSGTANKRPIPTAMSDGQLAVNTNLASPGLFFKDSNGDLVKAGPVHVGTTAPNASPASTAATALVANTIYQILTIGTSDFTAVGASANTVGVVFTASGTTTGTGTVSGQQGNETGEQWLDTTNSLYVMKVYDGTGWQSVTETISLADGTAAAPSLHFGNDTNTGLFRKGADALSITTAGTERLQVNDDGGIVIPGTLVSSGNITASDIIVNSAGTAAAPSYRFSLGSGFFSPSGTDHVAISTASTERLTVDGSGSVQIHKKIDYLANNGTSLSGLIGNAPLCIVSGADGDLGIKSEAGNITFITGGGGGIERMRIDTSGNVGIGTSSPEAYGSPNYHTLEIAGDYGGVFQTSSADDTVRAYFYSDTNVDNARIGTITNHPFLFVTNTTEKMRIDSSGAVGIGTSSPSGVMAGAGSSLTVASTTHSEINFVSATNDFGSLYFGDTTSGAQRYAGYLEYSHANDYMRFGTGTIERLRIDSSGNVGIGTTSPSEKFVVSNGGNEGFEVVPASASNLNVFYNYNRNTNAYIDARYLSLSHQFWTGSSSSEAMRIDSSGRLLVGTTTEGAVNADNLTINDSGDAGITIRSSSANAGSLFFSDSTTGAGEYAGYLQYDQSSNYLAIGTNSTERMRIDSSGKVGIGTTSPGGNLTVTDASTYTLDVKANGGDGALLTTLGGSASLALGTNSTERMRIDSSGNVGIGTTTPASTLHVSSPTGGAGIQIGVSASTEYQYVNFGSTGTGHYGWQVGRASSGATFAPANGFFIYNAQTSLTEFAIDANGHIGMGTPSPYETSWGPSARQLHLRGTQYAVMHLSNTTYGATWSHGAGGSSNVNYMAYDGSAHWLTIAPTSGLTKMQGVYNNTTSSGANVNVHSDGSLYRSTSSVKYKTDVETLEDQYADAILNCRPVWYRSVCDGDIVDKSRNKSEFGYYGFIAEEVAEIDPRLVSWRTKENVKNDDGWEVDTADLDSSEYEAEGVNYTNFVPLLLNLLKRQRTELEALKTEVSKLRSN